MAATAPGAAAALGAAAAAADSTALAANLTVLRVCSTSMAARGGARLLLIVISSLSPPTLAGATMSLRWKKFNFFEKEVVKDPGSALPHLKLKVGAHRGPTRCAGYLTLRAGPGPDLVLRWLREHHLW